MCTNLRHRNYGDVKSLIGFIKFRLDGGYNSIKDNLSTKDSEEYEAHVETLKADLVTIYSDRDSEELKLESSVAELAQFQKENKPNGPDDTYAELFQYLDERNRKWITKIFRYCWDKNES